MPKKPALTLVQRHQTLPAPPRPLGPDGQALWERVHDQYRIQDAGGLEVLAQACAALDRAERCRAQIDDAGELLVIKGAVRSNPLLRDEIQLRALVVRCIAQLGLDVEPVKTVGRPGGK